MDTVRQLNICIMHYREKEKWGSVVGQWCQCYIWCESSGWKKRFLCSTEEEEGAILLTQTELRLSELLAMADGGRNERQMEKSLPTCLSSSRSVCVRGDDSPGVNEKCDWILRNMSPDSHAGVRKSLYIVCMLIVYLFFLRVNKCLRNLCRGWIN